MLHLHDTAHSRQTRSNGARFPRRRNECGFELRRRQVDAGLRGGQPHRVQATNPPNPRRGTSARHPHRRIDVLSYCSSSGQGGAPWISGIWSMFVSFCDPRIALALAWSLLAAPTSVELVDEVHQISANQWRCVDLALTQQPALVSATFRELTGSGQARIALMRSRSA